MIVFRMKRLKNFVDILNISIKIYVLKNGLVNGMIKWNVKLFPGFMNKDNI